ncbi:hypothetical protein Tco_1272191 [Tanacetum coccineum]
MTEEVCDVSYDQRMSHNTRIQYIRECDSNTPPESLGLHCSRAKRSLRHHFVHNPYPRRGDTVCSQKSEIKKLKGDCGDRDSERQLLILGHRIGDALVVVWRGGVVMGREFMWYVWVEFEEVVVGSQKEVKGFIRYLIFSLQVILSMPSLKTQLSMSLIKQFWQTPTASKLEDEDMGITATIDGKVKVVSEASIRRHLKLEDSDGISTLSTAEIFEQLALMGYVSNSDSLTFQKGHFSPQWKILIRTILHCLSSKNTTWEQFSSNIATAIICLATNRTFNFSKLIFEAMVKNLDSKTKFLMYPRFIQIFLNKHKRLLLPHKRIYIAPTLTQKLFSNMKRASKGYTGMDTPLFQTNAVQGQHYKVKDQQSQLLQCPMIHLSHGSLHLNVEDSLTLNELTVHYTLLSKKVESSESDLKQTKQTYGAAYTKLIIKVKKLEHKVKAIKARRKVKLVISDDEDDLEDPSKQGRKIAQIDKDEGITLVQMGAQTQGRSDEDIMYVTSIYDYLEGFIGPSITITTVELVQLAPGERNYCKKKGISPPVLKISAKDKGKAIMTEPEKPLKKKDQIQSDEELALRLHSEEQAEFKRLQKVRVAQEEASRAVIYEEIDNIQAMIEAESKRFFAAQRVVEQRSKPPTKTQMRNRMCTYLKNMGGYKHNQLKGKSYEEI